MSALGRKQTLLFTQRIYDVFHAQGKPWTETTEKKVKETVAQCVKAKPKKALNPHKRGSIDTLVSNLEALIT